MAPGEESPKKKPVLHPPIFGQTALDQRGSARSHSPVLHVPSREEKPAGSPPPAQAHSSEPQSPTSERSVVPDSPTAAEAAPSGDVAPRSSGHRRRRSRSSDPEPLEDTAQDRRRGGSRSRAPLGLYALVVMLAALLAVCVFIIFRLLDSEEVVPPSEALVDETAVEVTGEELRAIDLALIKLRSGDTDSALERLKLLQSDNPLLPSLDYLTALAALQAGDISLASSSIEASLGKGERVSDSLALSAALEGVKTSEAGWQPMGDLKTRAEHYLRQAIEADPANPSPQIELAMRYRGGGDQKEAQRLLEAAKARINPVDSSTVVDTTLLLIRLQDLPDDQLPADLDPDLDTASLIGAAYVALRRGDFATAATLLATAKKRLPENLYYYLLGDPALRPYAAEPQLTPLFR